MDGICHRYGLGGFEFLGIRAFVRRFQNRTGMEQSPAPGTVCGGHVVVWNLLPDVSILRGDHSPHLHRRCLTNTLGEYGGRWGPYGNAHGDSVEERECDHPI